MMNSHLVLRHMIFHVDWFDVRWASDKQIKYFVQSLFVHYSFLKVVRFFTFWFCCIRSKLSNIIILLYDTVHRHKSSLWIKIRSYNYNLSMSTTSLLKLSIFFPNFSIVNCTQVDAKFTSSYKCFVSHIHTSEMNKANWPSFLWFWFFVLSKAGLEISNCLTIICWNWAFWRALDDNSEQRIDTTFKHVVISKTLSLSPYRLFFRQVCQGPLFK